MTGALRTITIRGFYIAPELLLNDWENLADTLWASTGNPEVKVFTSYSGRTFNVLPDVLDYDRYFNRIEYTLALVETILG